MNTTSTISDDHARLSTTQPVGPQLVARKARTAQRAHASRLTRAGRDLIDAALEARLDCDEVAREHGVDRGSALHVFSQGTRRMVRQLQSEVRTLRAALQRAA
jgi:hypothetical protein